MSIFTVTPEKETQKAEGFMLSNEPLDYLLLLSEVFVEPCKKKKKKGIWVRSIGLFEWVRAGVFSASGTLWDCVRLKIALTWGLLLQSRDINPPQGSCAALSTHEQKMLRDHRKLKTASTLPATTSGLLKAQIKEGPYA